eukprot:CAMPEP_0179346004 /NCGR_PEP_ID=MMETSP0797-20121207/72347_1 /TAXON_ID=47934 /ORGANISM="Dinophysis acuminata, Strain DAEP01" /LENGTH=421 /DNA_ID=CAMNT_0021060533 /DNA_START=11 /DNA_END=1276 /DNA_ORIENTATION=-
MAGGSSSSSSSDESSAKQEKKKKSKKAKKKKKVKEKVGKGKARGNDEEKQRRREKRAALYTCDRPEAVRLIGQLLQLDDHVADELEPVFSAIDAGEVVCIDGLANKTVRKKLRHLMQALQLTPAEGSQAFRSANIKVSFVAVFRGCLRKARAKLGGGAANESDEGNAPEAIEIDGAADSPRGGGGAADAEDQVCAAEGDAAAAGAPPPPAKPSAYGPQLPMPGVGPVGDADSSEDDAPPQEGEAGPKVEGMERRGVDLDALPSVPRREEWMSMPHESMAGDFAEGAGRRGGAKRDHFEVTRSREEQEAFEEAMVKNKKPSLLQQSMEGSFAGHEDDHQRMRKRNHAEDDVWGMSAKAQERKAAAPKAGGTLTSGPRRAFDPEQDLKVRKPMSGADFSKLVENSVSDLEGRFSRGNVATAFL